MKPFIIATIVVFCFANHAFGLGSHGGRSANRGSDEVGNAGGNPTENRTKDTPNINSTKGSNSNGGSGDSSFTLTSVTASVSIPEPTTVALVGSALIGIWGIRRQLKNWVFCKSSG